MTKIVATIMLFNIFLLSSCGQTVQNNDNHKDSIVKDRVTAKKRDSVKQASTNIFYGPDTITKLPFGSRILKIYKFKEYSKVPEIDPSIESTELTPDQKKYEELFKEFQSLHNHFPIVMPKIEKFTRINIGDSNSCTDSTKYQSEIKYHLPNFGPYQAYYQYHRFENDYVNCTEYGDLVLYNPQSKEAKMLNIYKIYGGEFQEECWFFYIDAAKVINIYIYYVDENDLTMKKAFDIRISDNGEIKIDKVN